MTGFGRGQAQDEQASVTVEMRSVNNRFCEVNVRMGRELSPYESAIQAQVKDAFTRGRITVQIQLDRAATHAVALDEAKAAAYAQALETLRTQLQIDTPVTLSHVLALPDLFTRPSLTDEDQAHLWALTQAALTDAIGQMRAMRATEGEALQADLAERVAAMRRHLEDVEARVPDRLTEARARLQERLAEIMADDRFDRDRLEAEMTILADRLDVTEEIVRLQAHYNVFDDTLNSNEAVGRRLNFIAQEMNREVNTIGSKANDAAVAHLAVRMKEELEKIREQVQNIE